MSNKRHEVKLSKIQTLFSLARRGEPKPKLGTPLGNALLNYASPASKSYDAVFSDTIRATRPDWFGRQPILKQRDNTPVEDAKDAMIQMALNGETIDLTHPWYNRLRRYTNPVGPQYDDEFTKLILILAPTWSTRSSQRFGDAATNKKAILMAADAGWTKPSRSTRMGQVLSTYTSINHKNYDGLFVARLMKRRPDWFALPVAAAPLKIAA